MWPFKSKQDIEIDIECLIIRIEILEDLYSNLEPIPQYYADSLIDAKTKLAKLQYKLSKYK